MIWLVAARQRQARIGSLVVVRPKLRSVPITLQTPVTQWGHDSFRSSNPNLIRLMSAGSLASSRRSQPGTW